MTLYKIAVEISVNFYLSNKALVSAVKKSHGLYEIDLKHQKNIRMIEDENKKQKKLNSLKIKELEQRKKMNVKTFLMNNYSLMQS